MTKRTLPAALCGAKPHGLNSEISVKALKAWSPGIQAADSDEAVIEFFDVIGEDYFGTGVTASMVAEALRKIGDGDVTVNINSPGGDMFEGIAIYNLLREHPGEVKVQVLGVAASSASLIAMAGDKITIAESAFLMIHNCWVVAIGNKDDLRSVANSLEPFDKSMAGIYAAQTGLPITDIAALLDEETWIGGAAAVEKGFADSLLPSDRKQTDAKAETELTPAAAMRRIDALLKDKAPRSERRRLLKALGDMPGAVSADTPSAVAPSGEESPALTDLRLALALSRVQTIIS